MNPDIQAELGLGLNEVGFPSSAHLGLGRRVCYDMSLGLCFS